MIRLYNTFSLSFLLLTCLFLGACSDDSPPQAEVPKAEAGPLWEDFNDPSQWDQPRVQFINDFPNKSYPAVYSMKLDGSDIRLAWSFYELSEADWGVYKRRPVRSPDNRYLAIAIRNSRGYHRIVVDLTTQKYQVMDEGGSPPSFTWASDSSAVYFWSDADVKRYQLDSKSLTTLPKGIKGRQIYLLKDQQTMLGEPMN